MTRWSVDINVLNRSVLVISLVGQVDVLVLFYYTVITKFGNSKPPSNHTSLSVDYVRGTPVIID